MVITILFTALVAWIVACVLGWAFESGFGWSYYSTKGRIFIVIFTILLVIDVVLAYQN